VTQPDSLDANYIPALRKIEIKWNDNTTLEEETIIERYVGAGSYTEYKKLPKNNNAKNKYDDTNFPASPAFYYYRVRQRLGTNIYTRYSNTDSTEVK
jgi:hypothetical protein